MCGCFRHMHNELFGIKRSHFERCQRSAACQNNWLMELSQVSSGAPFTLTSQVQVPQRFELKERVERCKQVLVEHEVGSSGQCRLALVVL